MADEQAKWAFNTAEWRMRDVRRFASTLKQAAADMDFGPVYEMLAGIITEWPYKGAPDKPDSYDDLRPEEWTETLAEVQAHLGSRFR